MALKAAQADDDEQVRHWALISLRKLRMSLHRAEAPAETAAVETVKSRVQGQTP